MRNPFRRERIAGIQQFLDIERKPHIYVFTSKRVVEIDYETMEEKTLVCTIKDVKKAKRVNNG